MAKAKKTKSGSWRCLVYDYTDSDGKRHYKSITCNDSSKAGKRKCEQMAANYAVEKKEERKRITDKTFGQELDKYLINKKPVLSPSTIRGYENIKNQLKKNHKKFYDKKILAITNEDVQILINDLSENKSPKTVRNYHGLISSVISPYINLNTTMPKRVQPELYIPSDEEIKRLTDATKGTELEIPVLLGAFGMMRRGEICGLSMNDIDGNIIHIHHSLVLGSDKKWHLKQPKTETSDRYIEVPDFVTNRIREIGHITTYNPHSLTISFERVLEKNDIHKFRFHDLRHYSASIRHAIGIPDAYIMEDGGWCSDKVLKDIYRHTMSDRKKEMSNKINNHFSDLCNS